MGKRIKSAIISSILTSICILCIIFVIPLQYRTYMLNLSSTDTSYFEYNFDKVPEKDMYVKWGMERKDNFANTYEFSELAGVISEATNSSYIVANYDVACDYFNNKMANDKEFADKMRIYKSELLQNGIFAPKSRDISTFSSTANLCCMSVSDMEKTGVYNYSWGTALYFYSNKHKSSRLYIESFLSIMQNQLKHDRKYIYACFRGGQTVVYLFDDFDIV